MLKLSSVILATMLAAATVAFGADKMEMKAADKAMAMPADGNVFFSDEHGKHALDPVCGMQITVGDKSPMVENDGKNYYFCSSGCSKAFAEKPAENIAKLALPSGVVAMSGNKMMVKCAVSGEKIAVDAKTPHQVYKGMDYYFCCNKCPKAFAKNPDKYATGSASGAPMETMEMKGEMDHEGHKGH